MLPLIFQPLFQFKEAIGERHLCRVSIDAQGNPVLLTLEHPPDAYPNRGRKHHPTDHRLPYRIYHFLSEQWIELDLEPAPDFYLHVQPLGASDWLLVGARRRGRRETAHVYDCSGALRRVFNAGEYVADVQVCAEQVWVSYLDQGVFGDDPLGNSGLVCLDPEGKLQFEYSRVDAPLICACYALNVASPEDVWVYTYTDFPLVHLRRHRVHHVWDKMPVCGAGAIAVHQGMVLMDGGYSRHTTLVLLALATMEYLEVQPVTPDGAPLAIERMLARGRRMFVESEGSLWMTDLAE